MKSSDMRFTAVILCAGKGERTGLAYNKILHYIGKKTVLECTLDAFMQSCVTDIVLVISPADEHAVREIVRGYENVRIVYGGATRTESVRKGLQAAEGCDVVAIHDGARPFVTAQLIDRTIESAVLYGSGIAAVAATDTIRQTDGSHLVLLPRETLRHMQTPQSFSYPLIQKAYAQIEGDFTDDAEVFARAGNKCVLVQGDGENKKITTPGDLFASAPARTRIGVGFDVHPLKEGRKLILGGVEIAHHKGLDGHSDADVLTHAIMDALLGAVALPDIGVLFPDTDAATEGISSLLLLDRVTETVTQKGYTVGNISAVVMAQKPRLTPHIPTMRETLAAHMHISAEQIGIAATTTEHLGIVGEEKGIAASATCLLYR